MLPHEKEDYPHKADHRSQEGGIAFRPYFRENINDAENQHNNNKQVGLIQFKMFHGYNVQ